MINLDTRVTPNPDLLETAVDGETIMIHLDLGRYFTLNGVGSEIWQGLKQGGTIGEICTTLAAAYDAPRRQIEGETLELVERLAERGIVTLT